MTPYYERAGVTIYHGDCRDVLPRLASVDFLLTDPPYPDWLTSTYQQAAIDFLAAYSCRQLIFWSAKTDFPLNYSAIHIWDKRTGTASEYERIFERNGGANFKVFRHYLINSSVAANFGNDTYTGHPSQKPIKLFRELIQSFSQSTAAVYDPFMGSGTTLRAAKDLGRQAIGIEIEERYCEIAAKRLSQDVIDFGAPAPPPTKQEVLL